MLWETGVLGCRTPKACSAVCSSTLERVFCLRGGEEQHQLKPSQFVRKKDPNHYVYIETSSKNLSGGLKEINLENKVVPVYVSPAAGERCLVHLLDWYLQKLSALAFERDVFYWQPKARAPDLQNRGMHVNLLESTSSTQWWRLCVQRLVFLNAK